MGLKIVPKKFGTPGPNLAPNLFGFNSLTYSTAGPGQITQKDKGPNLGEGSQTFWGQFLDPYVKFGPPD